MSRTAPAWRSTYAMPDTRKFRAVHILFRYWTSPIIWKPRVSFRRNRTTFVSSTLWHGWHLLAFSCMSATPVRFHKCSTSSTSAFTACLGSIFEETFGSLPFSVLNSFYGEAKSSVVHLTGSKDGEVVGGSGLVIQSNYILTCRHVVEGVDLDTSQEFQGMPCTVDPNMIYLHSTEDIALIRVDRTLTPLKGAVFRKPIIAQSVYTIGYPRLPNTRNASLTMQPGSVTNECVMSLSGETLFLYSAISRPGNSGGPILSEDGYVVGVAVEDHSATYAGDQVFSPHYAGIPAEIVVKAVEELVTDIQLVIEELD